MQDQAQPAANVNSADGGAPTRPRELVVFGLGPIGAAALEAATADERFAVAGCVDPREDREAIARQLGYDGPVLAEPSDLDGDGKVAVVCTGSTIAGVAPLAIELVEAGFDVVSTCEELIAPELGSRSAVAEVDAAARAAERTVVGAGVNPGFVMDVLPAVMTMPVRDVEQVRVLRRVDVGRRRLRLQEKVGVGISLDEFAERRSRDAIGHVGLRASLVFLANALGWGGGESWETVDPVVDWGGETSRGVRHVAQVSAPDGTVRVEALLEMYAGAPAVDRIEVDARPSVALELVGGLQGDQATIAATLNTAARVAQMRPGLRTPHDLLTPVWQPA
jgi:hypothetical protein